MADKIKTCDSDDVDSAANAAKQLTIYGSIIANQLIANRTYGAAPGINSIVPAEIIDFDPTLYLWKGVNEDSNSEQQEGSSSGEIVSEDSHTSIDIVYTSELAPRR